MSSVLSAFQEALILSLCPDGAKITEARYFQEEYLPCPIMVRATSADGRETPLVLRIARHGKHGVEREVKLYRSLARLGLPVPEVLSEVKSDPDHPGIGQMAVLSLLPGKDLQKWSEVSPSGLELACTLLSEGIGCLQQLTEPLHQDESTADLPRRDLGSELQQIVSQGGPWLQEVEFVESAEVLGPFLFAIDIPLSFSNGDYQPGNFLSDGHRLTGFVDFESACFEDPHVGLAKYPIYDLRPLNKAGFVSQYLRDRGLSASDFAPRLALRCLSTLQREISVSGQEDAGYRNHVLRLLRQALSYLK